MQTNLEALLEFLIAKREELAKEHWKYSRLSEEKRGLRQVVAQDYLEFLVPNLNILMINRLCLEFPKFSVQTVSWFGRIKRVRPFTSIKKVRKNLGIYFDNLSEKPETWEEAVGELDRALDHIQNNLIQINNRECIETDARIEAIKELANVDLKKMNPDLRKEIEEAVATYIHGGGEGYLCYQLLSPESEYRQEIKRIKKEGSEVPESHNENEDSFPTRSLSLQKNGNPLSKNEVSYMSL